MSRLRSDLWCSAFVRRHNDAGTMCVVARKGDPVAGQVWIEFDHIDGTSSLLSPAPSLSTSEGSNHADWVFQTRFDRVSALEVSQRLAKEVDFDPDFWHLVVESRKIDGSLTIVPSAS